MHEKWGIEKIYVLSKKHKKSYDYFNEILNTNIEILSLDNFFLKNIKILKIIFFSRIFSKKIFFFHECSWPTFDLIIKIIKPAGFYFPQVSLDYFERISPSKPLSFLKISITKKFILKTIYPLFEIYTKREDNHDKLYASVFLKVKKYPKSIKCHPLNYVRNNFTDIQTQKLKTKKEILFLPSTDTISSEELVSTYEEILRSCLDLDFNCHIKSHPNKEFRLDINSYNCTVVESEIPAELIFDRFDYLIGTSSTSLVFFNKISISIVDLFGDMYLSQKTRLHFNGIDNINKVLFPNNIQKIINLLKKGTNDY